MSPLTAARRMAEHPPTVLDSVTNRLHCGYCGQAIVTREDHAEDCPWLAQGQIVAALEVAERAMREWGHTNRCPFCGPRLQRRPERRHDEVCPWQALAMSLEEQV